LILANQPISSRVELGVVPVPSTPSTFGKSHGLFGKIRGDIRSTSKAAWKLTRSASWQFLGDQNPEDVEDVGRKCPKMPIDPWTKFVKPLHRSEQNLHIYIIIYISSLSEKYQKVL